MSDGPARALVAELIGPGLAAELDPGADLVCAGVNSGDLVRLALLVEERCGVDLTSADLAGLRSLEGIDRVLRRAGREAP